MRLHSRIALPAGTGSAERLAASYILICYPQNRGSDLSVYLEFPWTQSAMYVYYFLVSRYFHVHYSDYSSGSF